MDATPTNWGSVADWVSGLGSFAAVVTALYLSHASQKIRLSGTFGVRTIVGPGTPPHDVIAISATNVGTRATVVTGIGFRTGLFRKNYSILIVGRDDLSHGVPKQLLDGETGQWNTSLQEHPKWIEDLCESFVTSYWQAKSLYAIIQTSNGGAIKIRAEQGLKKRVIEVIKNKRQ